MDIEGWVEDKLQDEIYMDGNVPQDIGGTIEDISVMNIKNKMSNIVEGECEIDCEDATYTGDFTIEAGHVSWGEFNLSAVY